MRPSTVRPKFYFEIVAVIVGIVCLIYLPSRLDAYYLHLFQICGIGVILVLGLNIFLGHCGQIHFGVGAHYCIGAYLSALLILKLGLHFFIAFPIALLLCVLISAVLGKILLKLRELMLALGTLTLAFIVYLTVFSVWRAGLGGDDGLSLPSLMLGTHELGGLFTWYFILAWVIACFLLTQYLTESRIGRAWKAIREDESAAEAMGINVTHYTNLAFIFCGTFAGLAGILLTLQSRWIGPDYFRIMTSTWVLGGVVIGGMGSNFGMLIAAPIVWLMPEVLVRTRDYEMVITGVLLFLVLRFGRQGLWPSLSDLIRRAPR